jgi:hypothetical protein
VSCAPEAGDQRIVELTAAECWTALQSTDLGRISLIVDEGPVTFPINFRVAEVDGRHVIAVRTRPGNVIDQPGRAACFEIDWVDADRMGGGSVLVRGFLVSAPASTGLDSRPMVAHGRDRWLVMMPMSTSGRLVSTPGAWTFHAAAYI